MYQISLNSLFIKRDGALGRWIGVNGGESPLALKALKTF
jgi:phage tail tape-measure protein